MSKRGITLNNCLGEGVSVADRGKGFIQINGRGVLLPEAEAIRLRDWLNAKYPAPPAAAHGDEIESLAVNRYRPTPDGLLHYKVVAGDGRRSLFTGTKAQCYLVAAKLTEAFLDGAYVQNSAAHGDDGRTCRFCQKRFDSAGECGNHVDQFHHGESEPVAHGDEAVQYRLLRVGEIIQATDELLQDDCTTWKPMGEGRQLGIGWKWHEGLMPMRRVDAAMRAQAGEGGEV